VLADDVELLRPAVHGRNKDGPVNQLVPCCLEQRLRADLALEAVVFLGVNLPRHIAPIDDVAGRVRRPLPAALGSAHPLQQVAGGAGLLGLCKASEYVR
jgi:hypothetical protein